MAPGSPFIIEIVRTWREKDDFNAVINVAARTSDPGEVDLRVRSLGVPVQFLRQTAPATATLTGLAHRYPTGSWSTEVREYHLCLRLPSFVLSGLLAHIEVVEAGFSSPRVLARVDVRIQADGGDGTSRVDDVWERARTENGGFDALQREHGATADDGDLWEVDEHERPSYLIEMDPDEVFGTDQMSAPEALVENWSAETQPAPHTGPPTEKSELRETLPEAGTSADHENVINTGFTRQDRPDLPLPKDRTLAAGQRYLWWLDVGPRSAMTIETASASLPAQLPPDADITVVLSGFPDGIGVDPAGAVAHLRMSPDGSAAPVFLPVTTPALPGTARMRCNLYWRQVLLQSRVVTVFVTERPVHHREALTSTVDYRLADPVDLAQLAELPTHTASVQLDDDSGGTHALRIVAHDGRELLRAETTIAEGQLTNQIQLARAALRRVTWGDDQPWRPGKAYRYRDPPSINQLTDDLALLAVNGYRLHHLLLRGMGRGTGSSAYDMGDRLAAALRNPGYVQIALKESAQHVLPAALLYDLPLDTNAARLTLCPDFRADLTAGQPLSCVRGGCRQATHPAPEIVCPGGFWGFRHALGLPVSLGAAASVPVTLPTHTPMLATAGLYRDFHQVDDHCAVLRHLQPGMSWRLTEDRASTLHELSSSEPQVVYFYCHGGVVGTVPYLRVGRGITGPVITPDNLYHARVQWPGSRPMVFLNGCQTTDLDPDHAIDFVSFFVEDAMASGVIGTEITVFEELARPFAEDCLRRFLTAGVSVGVAVRDSRTSLLSRGNPLGLAYIPFALPAIKIQPIADLPDEPDRPAAMWPS